MFFLVEVMKLSRHSVAQVGRRLWQADLCNFEVLRLYDASLVRPLRCEVWLSSWFACLSLQADQPSWLYVCQQRAHLVTADGFRASPLSPPA